MDFLSSLYQNIKIGVAGLGSAGSIACIIVGSLATHGVVGIVMIVGGSVWLLTSGFVLFDSIKVHSLIRKDVNRLKKLTNDFRAENFSLKKNVQELGAAKEQIQRQNDLLQINIENASKQIYDLSLLKTEYEKNNKNGKKNLRSMTAKIKELADVKDRLNNKLANLSEALEIANKEVDILQTLKDDYEVENKKLQELNKENKAAVKVLKKEVNKLRELYRGTKKLLVKLATAGDMFKEFGDTIGGTTKELGETKEGYDDTLRKMNKLLKTMKDSSFKDIDCDGDGAITEKEFMNFVES